MLKSLKKCSPRSGNMAKCLKRLTQHPCFNPRCCIFSCNHISTHHLNMFDQLPAPWPLAFVFSLLPGFFFRCHHSFDHLQEANNILQLTMVSFLVKVYSFSLQNKEVYACMWQSVQRLAVYQSISQSIMKHVTFSAEIRVKGQSNK